MERKVYKMSGGTEEIRKEFYSICYKYQYGDQEEKKKALENAIKKMEHFISFVINKKFGTYMRYYDDLFQEGCIGVIKGMQKYDPDVSAPTTHFYNYIIHEIHGYISREINKTTNHYSSHIQKINKCISKFESDGVEWTDEMVMETTGINEETYGHCREITNCNNMVHFDAPEVLDEQLTCQFDGPEAAYLKEEMTNTIYSAIDNLTEQEKFVLTKRYGLDGSKTCTFNQIGDMLGIKGSDAINLKTSAFRKLKKNKELAHLFDSHTGNDNYEKDAIQLEMIENTVVNTMKEIEELEFSF